MPTQQQLMFGFGAIAVIVVLVILFYSYGYKSTKKTCVLVKTQKGLPPLVEIQASNKLSPVTAEPEPENAMPPVTPEALPPLPPMDEAPSTETVTEHRAELMRGTAKSRARMSAPTTSALIMSSALTGRDVQGSRQNIGQTAMMDRLTPSPSGESVPW